MRSRRRFRLLASALVVCSILSLAALPSGAADDAGRLRTERARLMALKAKAEKTAAELSETLARQKLTRSSVAMLQSRLERQRGLIARIDRKLGMLGKVQEATEAEAAAIANEQKAVRKGLEVSAAAVHVFDRGRRALLPNPPREERLRHFARRILLLELEHYEGLGTALNRKEERLSALNRQIRDSERRMEKEQKRGDALRSREEAERQRLAELEARKKEKEKEIKAIRGRIARMESFVRKIERRMKARETAKGAPAARRGVAHFRELPGGMSPPVSGKVVSRFGRQVDPVFGVAVENRGVEIEGAAGSPVRSVAKGTVAFVGPVPDFGRVLILQHGSGLFSVYGKAETFSVRTGQGVGRGEVVGRLPASPSGRSVLYLELRVAGTAVDPASAIPLP